MQLRRFYISPDALTSEPVLLDHEESHHLIRVLRLKEGDNVELFDGTGALHTGTIEQLGKRVAIRLESVLPRDERQGGSIILCQGDLKGAANAWRQAADVAPGSVWDEAAKRMLEALESPLPPPDAGAPPVL